MPETNLRPSQQAILKYRAGKMGISAVPGSGKTWTLSLLASEIIISGQLRSDQEVLIVTFANSAVDNFSNRISEKLKKAGLLPGYGYTIRTLHGLAHDILRERPDLVGLSNDFNIIDPREANLIKSRIVQKLIVQNPAFLEIFGNPNDSDAQREYRKKKDLPDLLDKITHNFMRSAKDRQLTPDDVGRFLEAYGKPLPLAELGQEMYADYQQSLKYANSVDFDDLVRLALKCLKQDPLLISNLRDRWPYILEDEAQDSSKLQQEILSLLSGENGNWVRVGDPNQAIYETFTTADPRLLMDFIKRSDVHSEDLPESGRSTQSIIDLANHLIDWTTQDHPNPSALRALALPYIQPTPENDPQKNPEDQPGWVELVDANFSADEEVHFITIAVEKWLAEHPDQTLAVLSPTNKHGEKIVAALKNRKLDVVDFLNTSSLSTRKSAGAISLILQSLANPLSTAKLAKAFQVWRRSEIIDGETDLLTKKAMAAIKKFAKPEGLLWPIDDDPLTLPEGVAVAEIDTINVISQFRKLMQRWQKAIGLPIDQLILTIAQDLFTDPVELALAHKLALNLQRMQQGHPEWELPELCKELEIIAKNERKMQGFSEDDTGFNPDNYPGKAVVSTIHRAKGLEWDKVFIASVNNYDFPSGLEMDSYYSERYYIRDNLNLEAEALEQLNVLTATDPVASYQEGAATLHARDELIRERLRLLFVGITRAKQSLTITWNKGMRNNSTEAIPMIALRGFWRDRKHQ